MEILIGICLTLFLATAGVKSFFLMEWSYKVNEAKEYIENLIHGTRTLALSWMSLKDSAHSQSSAISKYFILIPRTNTWQWKTITYGEIQNDKVYYIEKTDIPMASFIRKIKADRNIINNNLFIFFNAPFGKISFLETNSDYVNEWFPIISDNEQFGEIELLLQFKDYNGTDEDSIFTEKIKL